MVYIGIDLGGTKTIVASADKSGNIIKKVKEKTPLKLNEGIEMLKRMVREVSSDEKIDSIGCSCGGPLDYKMGVVSPLHQPEWREIPLKEIMEKEFNCRFAVDVDTNTAAMAEHKHGLGKNYRSFVYITLSTGMGGAIMTDGKLLRGKGHPEVGHQTGNWIIKKHQPNFSLENHFCECGVKDCLEGMISGSDIKKIYGKLAEEIEDPEIWNEIGYNLGQGLRNISAIHSPEAIIVGGGVGIGLGEKILQPAREVVKNNLKIVPIPDILLSKLGYETALMGSLVLAIEGDKHG